MSALYETRVSAVGGRNGTVRSDDGLLELPLALPVPLGGQGGATNPEQLFAAGYAACFGNAVIHVTRAQNDKVLDNDIEVISHVGLGPNSTGGYKLSVTLEVTIAGFNQANAEAAVQSAHEVCPYSNAIKGNVDVWFLVKVR